MSIDLGHFPRKKCPILQNSEVQSGKLNKYNLYSLIKDKPRTHSRINGQGTDFNSQWVGCFFKLPEEEL